MGSAGKDHLLLGKPKCPPSPPPRETPGHTCAAQWGCTPVRNMPMVTVLSYTDSL